MKIECYIDATTLTGTYGNQVSGVCTTCSRCGHSTESFGTRQGSIRRCLALMRQECINEENNFYVVAGGWQEMEE